MKPKKKQAPSTYSDERAFKEAIRRVLRSNGIFCWAAGAGPFTMPGVSDIIAIWNGRLIAIEAKQPGKRPTKPQQDFIDRINAEGGRAFWADDMALIDDLIKELTT